MPAGTINRNDVEAHRGIGKPRCPAQEKPGGERQLVLLAAIDGLKGTRISARLAIAYFNEDQAVRIAHHEVDFTKPAMEIACDQFEPPGQQVCQRQVFCVAA